MCIVTYELIMFSMGHGTLQPEHGFGKRLNATARLCIARSPAIADFVRLSWLIRWSTLLANKSTWNMVELPEEDEQSISVRLSE